MIYALRMKLITGIYTSRLFNAPSFEDALSVADEYLADYSLVTSWTLFQCEQVKSSEDM